MLGLGAVTYLHLSFDGATKVISNYFTLHLLPLLFKILTIYIQKRNNNFVNFLIICVLMLFKCIIIKNLMFLICINIFQIWLSV